MVCLFLLQLFENMLLLICVVLLILGMCSGFDFVFNVWDVVEFYVGRLFCDESGNFVQEFVGQVMDIMIMMWWLFGCIDCIIMCIDDGNVLFDILWLECCFDWFEGIV